MMQVFSMKSMFYVMLVVITFAYGYWLKNQQFTGKPFLPALGGAVVVALIVYLYLTMYNFCDTIDGYKMLHISPGARCQGGPYMWQGDSEEAKFCQAMFKSKEGRCAIQNFNCPNGYHGQPSRPFAMSPLSGNNWENERCGECGAKDKSECRCDPNAMCSMNQHRTKCMEGI